MRVYLSSTSIDLKDHREAVIKVIKELELEPIAMEYYTAAPVKPLDKCLGDVRRSNIYVGIFAWRYGFIPEGYDKSITELEYQEAEKTGIPRLIFLIDEKHEWPEEYRDTGETFEKACALRAELQNNLMVGSFTHPDDLAKKAATALGNILKTKGTRKQVAGLRFYETKGTFKDRENEIGDLRNLLKEESAKFICVVGRGGSGKTALISKLCEEIEKGDLRLSPTAQEVGADGIIYISFKGIEKYSLERIVYDYITRVLNEKDSEEVIGRWKAPSLSIEEKTRFLLEKIKSGYYLLVLDNIEDILSENHMFTDGDLKKFFNLCLTLPHTLRIVATSRRKVVVGDSGLQWVRNYELEKGLPEDQAVSLLRDLDPQGEIGLKNAAEKLLLKVARRCFGLPRAIEFICGLLRRKGSRALNYLEKLIADDTLFNKDVVENLSRETFENLSERQQKVIQALAVYNSPVEYEAIEYLLQAFPPEINLDEALYELEMMHMIASRGDTTTYELHPIDQQYAYSKFPDGEVGFTKKNCHIRAGVFFLEEAEKIRAGRSLETYEERKLLTTQEIDKWVEYIGNMIKHFHTASAWEHIIKANLMIRYYLSINPKGEQERKEIYDLMIQAARITKETSIEADYLHECSVSLFHLNNYGEAENYCNQCIDVSMKCQYTKFHAHALHRMALARYALGFLDEAKSLMLESLSIREKNGWLIMSAQTQGAYANLLEFEGKFIEASEMLSKCKIAFHELNILWEEVFTDYYIARIMIRQWELQNAAEILDNALETIASLGSRGLKSRILLELGKLFILTGKFIEGERKLSEAIKITKQYALWSYYSEALHLMGLYNHIIGNHAESCQNYIESLSFNSSFTSCFTKILLGISYVERNMIDEARLRILEGIQLGERIIMQSPKLYEVRSYFALGLLALGRTQEALSEYRKTLEICSAQGIVKIMLQELSLLKHAAPETQGLNEVEALLENAFSRQSVSANSSAEL